MNLLLRRLIGVIAACAAPAFSQWRALGPYGGEAEIVRVDPGQPSTVLAASRNGLLYRSEDHGATWIHLPFPAQLYGVLHAIEMDPQRPGVWYAGVEGDASRNSGVYKTTDWGMSWTLLSGLAGKDVWSLAIWLGDSRVVSAGAADGVYRSRDAGETWQRISPESNLDLRPVVSLAFDPVSQEVIYAGTTHLPWRTTNGGMSWESIHSGMLDDSDVFSIHVNPKKTQIVYASACSGAYRSNTRGNLWTRLATPRGAFRTYLVTLDPDHPDTVFAATSAGLLKSGDGGVTFRKVSPHAVKSIAFDPSQAGRVYFASSTGGLLVSTDGGENLHESNQGFANHTVTSLSGSKRVLYVSIANDLTTGGLLRSEDLGITWRSAPKGASANGQNIRLAAPAFGNPNVVFAAPSRGLLNSVDGGLTWSSVNPPPGDQRITALLALRAAPEAILAGTSSGLFRTVNRGSSWTLVLPKESRAKPRVQLLQSSGESNVAVITDAGAFLSLDNGASWLACGQTITDLPGAGVQWYGLAADTTPAADTKSAGLALAATSHGLFRSLDGCRSWTMVENGLAPGTVGVVIGDPANAGEFFAAQQGKIFHSRNGGAEWTPLNDSGRTALYPSALLILPEAQERLFALFPRQGVLSNASPILARRQFGITSPINVDQWK